MKSLMSLIAFFVTTSASATALEGRSVYESDYIRGKGQFMVRVESTSRCGNGEQTVAVYHDRNSCELSELGLPSACTRMGPSEDSGKLKYVAVAAARNTAVYRVEGTRYAIVTELNADSAPYSSAVRLLILNEQGKVVDAVSLKRDFSKEPVIEPIRQGDTPPQTRCN